MVKSTTTAIVFEKTMLDAVSVHLETKEKMSKTLVPRFFKRVFLCRTYWIQSASFE
jgi:hypothetical protein